MGRSTNSPVTPGEVLRDWQRGACDWLQVLNCTTQQWHSAGIHEANKFLQHMKRQRTPRHARGPGHAAFASLSASLPAAQPRERNTSRVRFAGKGLNCIASDLADSAVPSNSQIGQTATDNSKPNSEELQEAILVSEVGHATKSILHKASAKNLHVDLG